MVAHLLYCRGYRTAEAIRGFFSQGIISHDPFLLPDMPAAVDRVLRAVEGRERVAVYGDFDCDGITAAAVLVEVLQQLGLEPIAHVPNRADGHGIHPEALASLADRDVDLVITADCGINALEEVQVARGMGLDIIVTDHHAARADGTLPESLVVSPTRQDSEYPCPFLCGVGVAYKVVQALATRLPGVEPESVLDLVALGTVADVVPLKDENRSLVVAGLKRLQRTKRPGLLALFGAAGVDARRIDPVSVAFYLAPRINAANRMATPQLAYDLITAPDAATATPLAEQLSGYNQQRQLLVAEHVEAIVQEIGDPSAIAADVLEGKRAPLLIVIGEWPAGISGLLASKVVDAYGLPTFVGSALDDGVVAVSARSIPGVHIDEILEGCDGAFPEGLFLGFGGHSGAGGFRVGQDKLSVAIDALQEQALRQVRIDEVGAVLTVDAEVSLRQMTLAAAKQVRALAPFGIGFPEPLFLARGVTLKRRSPVGGDRHARLVLQQGMSRVDGVLFDAPPEFWAVPMDAKLDIVFNLQLSEWNGLTRLELRLRDWRTAK